MPKLRIVAAALKSRLEPGSAGDARKPEARWFAPALLGLTLALAGCANVPLTLSEPAAEAAPVPVLDLEIRAPAGLSALLAQHLDLGRVNRVSRGEPLVPGELQRLVQAAPAQARALLDTEGFFDAQVEVQVVDEEAPPPQVDPATAPEPQRPRVRVQVDPGPQTRVVRLDFTILGDLALDEPAHARATAQRLRQTPWWPTGSPFRADDWARVKSAALASVRAQGYLRADWRQTQAEIDAPRQAAHLTLVLDSGPLFVVGGLRIRGLTVQDGATVTNLVHVPTGSPATESALLDAQERLQRSDLFDRATVTLPRQPEDPLATEITVRLGERPLQSATVALGYAADVGARIALDHAHRRPFGQAWMARNRLELAQRQQRWEGELSTQTLPRLYRHLVGLSLEQTESSADRVRAARVRMGRSQDTPRISRLLYAQWDHSSTLNALGTERADALGLYLEGIWRRLDDLLLPTHGHVWSAQLGVGQARSRPGEQGPFARVRGRLDVYRALSEPWTASARLELGQVVAARGVRVPEGLRFRAGGDGSVRGYGYRALTPTVAGVPVGGEVVATGSLELARPVSSRWPDLLGAVFIDAGNAAERWQSLDPAVGWGAGVRYRSPVGPLRLDLAWGEAVRDWRLHLSVGLSF